MVADRLPSPMSDYLVTWVGIARIVARSEEDAIEQARLLADTPNDRVEHVDFNAEELTHVPTD